MKYAFSFEIPFQLPSLNEYISAMNSNRFKGAAMKKQIESDIMWFLKKNTVTQPCTIRFLWHEKTKKRDKDNVAFGKKFILDAMQKAGMLKNDNNQFVNGFEDRFFYGEKNYIRVEIYYE